MARKYKFCVNCRRTITESELRRGLYVEARRGILCATCAQQLDEELSQPAPASPPSEAARESAESGDVHDKIAADHLENIQRQIEAIQRILLFETSSSWTVLAGMAQLLAVGMMVIAGFRWLDDPLDLLLVALIFQVMALTFFVKARS